MHHTPAPLQDWSAAAHAQSEATTEERPGFHAAAAVGAAAVVAGEGTQTQPLQ